MNGTLLQKRRQASALSLGSAQYSWWERGPSLPYRLWCFVGPVNPTRVTRRSNQNGYPGPASALHVCQWPFCPGFVGPWFLLQLSNAVGSFYFDFSCNKLALSVIWHLKVGIKAGGNFSLKEINLENSVKKVKPQKLKPCKSFCNIISEDWMHIIRRRWGSHPSNFWLHFSPDSTQKMCLKP